MIFKTALAALFLTTIIASSHAADAPKLADLPKNPDGAYILFNGKDLTGWEGNPNLWSVADGTIQGKTTPEHPANPNTFLIFKGGNVKDFELHAMFKLENHNSGIQYRSKIIDPAKWVVGGYQADMDGTNQYTGMCYEEKGRGMISAPGEKLTLVATSDAKGFKKEVTGKTAEAKDIKAAIKAKEWNEYVIIAQGNHIVQKVNGVTTVDITDEDEKHRAMEGVLALQIHQGPPMVVQFKEITLKVLDSK